MADRIGVINKGELILVEEKTKLMQKLGKRQLTLNLQEPMTALPAALGGWPLALKAGGNQLEYTFDARDPAAAGHAQGHPVAAASPGRAGDRLQGPEHQPELAGRDLRQPGQWQLRRQTS